MKEHRKSTGWFWKFYEKECQASMHNFETEINLWHYYLRGEKKSVVFFFLNSKVKQSLGKKWTSAPAAKGTQPVYKNNEKFAIKPGQSDMMSSVPVFIMSLAMKLMTSNSYLEVDFVRSRFPKEILKKKRRKFWTEA